MPTQRIHSQLFHDGFSAVRAELGVAAEHDADLIQAAQIAAKKPLPEAPDRTEIPLVTIDPPGSMDLDQAYASERIGRGYRVWYAIADVGWFVEVGDLLDEAAVQQGLTLYSPDTRLGLYPAVLGEDAASLLPNVDRSAVLWRIDLNAAGEPTGVSVERAIVRSRAQLTYAEAQGLIDADGGSQSLALLAEIGTLRQSLERARGAVSLNLPDQQIRQGGNGYEVVYDETLPIEGWNAQISLLTGLVAAQLMLDSRIGVLRTLPAPRRKTLVDLRSRARALNIAWPSGVKYPEFIRGLDPSRPRDVSLLTASLGVFRGAGYEAFVDEPPKFSQHAAVAGSYAHVTAPLRRLCDRYANEALMSLARGLRPEPEILERLLEVPAIMGRTSQAASKLDRAMVDFVEAAVLLGRVDEQFDAVVVARRKDQLVVQVDEPAVVTRMADDGQLTVGSKVTLVLKGVDVAARTVEFATAPS
jgi:exoribonuclease R